MEKQIIHNAEELRAWYEREQQGNSIYLNEEMCYYATYDKIAAKIQFPCLLITHWESRRSSTDDLYAVTITPDDLKF